MINTNDFYNLLTEKGLSFFAGVPDSLLSDFCSCIMDNSPDDKNIITANEGNAVAVCAGYYLATGKCGVVYMQNSGEGNAINPLLSLADKDVYSIPMLLIIGWRGEPGKPDEPQHVKQGKVTLSILDTIGIKHDILRDNYIEQVRFAVEYMDTYKRPYALVVQKGVFSEYKFTKKTSKNMLTREQSLDKILSCFSTDDMVVSTTGKTSREIFELRERSSSGHANDFLTVGSMGHTASIAYGISLGTKKNVWCIDGDGSFIMHMGSLAVIGANIPCNFKYILNDNNAHESVGGQPTCSDSIDIPAVLKGVGFVDVIVARTLEEIELGIQRMKETSQVAMIIRTKPGSRKDLGRPINSPIVNKELFMNRIKE